jgi:streptogramin lyase
VKGSTVRRLGFVVAIFLAASLLAACANSGGLLNKHQLRTPLQCPCPAIAPLATYTLPSEVPFGANAYLGGIITGPDGNIWVAESDANKIARVTEGGSITEFPVPTAGAYPAIIAVGPDGNLWFVEGTFNTIGRITTAGVITEFPLPPPLSTAPQNLSTIYAGPDGNMWFTHLGANVIGVMSTSGSLIATYPVPTANSLLGFIIPGPDGNMWFTEENGNKIGRITLTGTITEFPIPTPNSNPKNLVLGADGAMWFPERDGAKIGRITTSGVITEYPVPATIYQDLLRRIVSTPDGSLWFLQAEVASPYNSEVGKMDLSGTVTNLWSFPNGNPQGMTVGPDGSPWFTDEANDTVVRL